MSKKSKGKRKRQALLDIFKYQNRLYIYGRLPTPSYLSFDRLEYAEEFCSGKIRFQALENYKSIEDLTRADGAEGFGEVAVHGESILVDLTNNTLNSISGVETVHADTFNEDSIF